MSKRPSSYDDVFIRQSKKRITEKDIACASDDKLRSLCEITVKKLFDGARSSAKCVDGNQNVNKPIQKICSSCHFMAVSACEHCTSYLCQDCRRICERCVEIYCHDCLDSQPDQTVCINCS